MSGPCYDGGGGCTHDDDLDGNEGNDDQLHAVARRLGQELTEDGLDLREEKAVSDVSARARGDDVLLRRR